MKWLNYTQRGGRKSRALFWVVGGPVQLGLRNTTASGGKVRQTE